MFTALAVAAALSAPVPKLAPELKWRFAKGDTFYVTAHTEATSTVNGGGGAVRGGSTATAMVFKATVTSAGEKETTLEVEVLSCEAGNGAGGPAKFTPQAEWVGKTATFTLDPAYKVTKADGLDQFGNAGGLLSAESFQGSVQDLLRAVPGKAVGKGEGWKGEEERLCSNGLTDKRTDAGRVMGVADGLVQLEIESAHAWAGKTSGVTFDLKGDQGKRVVVFDPKAGRVRKLEETYTAAGSISVGGNGPNAAIEMTVKATVTVSDEKPKAAK